MFRDKQAADATGADAALAGLILILSGLQSCNLCITSLLCVSWESDAPTENNMVATAHSYPALYSDQCEHSDRKRLGAQRLEQRGEVCRQEQRGGTEKY